MPAFFFPRIRSLRLFHSSTWRFLNSPERELHVRGPSYSTVVPPNSRAVEPSESLLHFAPREL
ncbi:hypothetical protein B9Z19DRAFT_1089174 [Tuber borchii]|uniref:Uncharacterized protein n=1 Tax=Tuber borchii TaxID=42251 RepID=A0A2T6ZKI4_TUBBO|nr:hypothetical protein B9Z19DRAFT_1089174 [Tuber borchii]